MRRRPPPPTRVWTLADMPEHLRRFDPLDWGCATAAQWEPEWQQAREAHRQAHRQWLYDHGVNPLEELRARRAARHADLRRGQ